MPEHFQFYRLLVGFNDWFQQRVCRSLLDSEFLCCFVWLPFHQFSTCWLMAAKIWQISNSGSYLVLGLAFVKSCNAIQRISNTYYFGTFWENDVYYEETLSNICQKHWQVFFFFFDHWNIDRLPIWICDWAEVLHFALNKNDFSVPQLYGLNGVFWGAHYGLTSMIQIVFFLDLNMWITLTKVKSINSASFKHICCWTNERPELWTVHFFFFNTNVLPSDTKYKINLLVLSWMIHTRDDVYIKISIMSGSDHHSGSRIAPHHTPGLFNKWIAGKLISLLYFGQKCRM